MLPSDPYARVVRRFESMTRSKDFEPIRAMESMTVFWLLFVGNYRTFMSGRSFDHEELFAGAAASNA